MSDCGVCLTSDCDGWDFYIEDTRMVTLARDQKCNECKRIVTAGTPIEEAIYHDDDDDEFDEAREAPGPLYTCAVCAEIAEAFYCEGRTFGLLWDEMSEIMGELNSSCFDKLTTAAAKAELQQRWMKWKGIGA